LSRPICPAAALKKIAEGIDVISEMNIQIGSARKE